MPRLSISFHHYFGRILIEICKELSNVQIQNIDSFCQRSINSFRFWHIICTENGAERWKANWQQKSKQVYGWHFSHSMKFNIELCTQKVPSVLFRPKQKLCFPFNAWRTELHTHTHTIDSIQKTLIVRNIRSKWSKQLQFTESWFQNRLSSKWKRIYFLK